MDAIPSAHLSWGLGVGFIILHFLHVVLTVVWWLVLLTMVLYLLPGVLYKGLTLDRSWTWSSPLLLCSVMTGLYMTRLGDFGPP